MKSILLVVILVWFACFALNGCLYFGTMKPRAGGGYSVKSIGFGGMKAKDKDIEIETESKLFDFSGLDFKKE